MSLSNRVEIFELQRFNDHRGSILYNNYIDFGNFKRSYFINHRYPFIRAWQYHPVDQKIFIPIQGEWEILWSIPTVTKNQLTITDFESIHLNENSDKVVYVPSQYANGLISRQPNSIIQVFSALYIEEALGEKIRIEHNLKL